MIFSLSTVTHPSPQEKTLIPSVVGVAASIDEFGFRYNCQWRLQDPRDEMIRDFEAIVREQLVQFKDNRGVFPKFILYYRDGVGDGQFQEVSQIELCAMRKACKAVGCQAKITFIVVQKRHHTRFFPIKRTPGDKNNNVVPGTVVDSEIVNPLVETFFLVSHQSIQGVAKPAKYVVIHDDTKIPAAELQVFTYGLCHLFARCNRVVSYPAPTYYAHLVAYRGRVYIHKSVFYGFFFLTFRHLKRYFFFSDRLKMNNLVGEYEDRKIKDNILKNNPMFFV